MPKASRKKYWADIACNDFKGRSVILPVCVRSPGVRGRNLTATLEGLAVQGISELHVIVCDTLDRWNIDALDPEIVSIKAADRWLETNRPALEARFSITMKRWSDVRRDTTFPPRLHLLTDMYQTILDVRRAVDAIADYYLRAKQQRCTQTGLAFDVDKERCRSTHYLLEEFAGTATYARWYPDVPEAYWGVYVGDHTLFQRLNTVDPSIDLTLPRTLPVQLNRLPEPVAGGVSSPAAA